MNGRSVAQGAIAAALFLAGCGAAPTSRPGQGIVALLTDYGSTDHYVGELAGVVLTANPGARVVTITHEVEPFNIREGAYLLSRAAPEFPAGTVVVAIVDPGVGTERLPVAVRTKRDVILIGPDNGLLGPAAAAMGVGEIVLLDNREYWRAGARSTTFHGRDIFGPVAGHLAAGVPLERMGRTLGALVPLPASEAQADREKGRAEGEVLHVDRYGNLLTNIRLWVDERAGLAEGKRLAIRVGEKESAMLWGKTYGSVPEGAYVAVINSEGNLEIAVNMGSAAKALGASAGTKVTVRAAAEK